MSFFHYSARNPLLIANKVHNVVLTSNAERFCKKTWTFLAKLSESGEFYRIRRRTIQFLIKYQILIPNLCRQTRMPEWCPIGHESFGLLNRNCSMNNEYDWAPSNSENRVRRRGVQQFMQIKKKLIDSIRLISKWQANQNNLFCSSSVANNMDQILNYIDNVY